MPIHPYEEYLPAKYLTGEASPEEAMQLDDWLQEPANRKEFDQLSRIWNNIATDPVLQVPDVEACWWALQVQLGSPRRSLLARLFLNRYAAAIVAGLCLILSIVWWRQGASSGMITKAATNKLFIEKLADGSAVTLKKGSSISYASSFNKSERSLVLTGEGYFKVAPNKAIPFMVQAGPVRVEVVGTEFNIRQWPSGDSVQVQVKEGTVKMYTDRSVAVLHKGQTGTFDKGSGSIVSRNEINKNSIGYATHEFSFENLSLLEVCQYLEVAYDVQIQLDVNARDCRLTGIFGETSIDSILSMLEQVLNIHWERSGEVIYIVGQRC